MTLFKEELSRLGTALKPKLNIVADGIFILFFFILLFFFIIFNDNKTAFFVNRLLAEMSNK